MNTKCTVIGEESAPKKELIPIEFKYFLNFDSPKEQKNSVLPVGELDGKPSDYLFIELICKDYVANDLMFAHNGNRSEGVLYMGKWNDGVVA